MKMESGLKLSRKNCCSSSINKYGFCCFTPIGAKVIRELNGIRRNNRSDMGSSMAETKQGQSIKWMLNSAFLYALLMKRFMSSQQPPGYVDPDHILQRFIKGVKALYGFSTKPLELDANLEFQIEFLRVKLTFFLGLQAQDRTREASSYLKSKESPFDLEAFSDSDYGGSNLDRKSTTGGCQFLGQRLISWQCKKQTIVATSTTEAEYVAAANCCGQVLWVQNQLLDYGFNFMNTKIHIDNESTICIVKNPVYHSKTKHIEIRHHFIRDCYEKKLISVEKIHTDLNVADLLTKPFDGPRFNYLVVSIGQEHDAVAPSQPSSSTPQYHPHHLLQPFEEPSPVHQPFSPPQEQAQGQMAMDDLLQVVPKLISRIDSLETDLKQTKLTMGNAIVKFRRKKNLSSRARKSQDDPLDSSLQGLAKSIDREGKIQEKKEAKGKKDSLKLGFTRRQLDYCAFEQVMGYGVVDECDFELIDEMNRLLANLGKLRDQLLVYFDMKTQREVQLATKINNLTRQLVVSIDERRLFIQELKCLPGNMMAYKTREKLNGLQKDDLIKVMKMRMITL
ncbi:hypothetical protein Tco_0256029 [Tanacetum coccineum]